MNKYFDKIYVITCSKCENRQPYIIEHFKKVNLNFEFVYSLDNSNFEDGPISSTMKSLIYGHIKCINDACLNNFEKILICEDDINFVDNVNEKFNQFISLIDNNWNFLQLGNQFWATQYLSREKIKENLYRFIWGTGSHCIGIHKSVYGDCVKSMSKYDECIDFMYYKLFQKYIAYCPEDFLADALSDSNHLECFNENFKFKSEIKHGYITK